MKTKSVAGLRVEHAMMCSQPHKQKYSFKFECIKATGSDYVSFIVHLCVANKCSSIIRQPKVF